MGRPTYRCKELGECRRQCSARAQIQKASGHELSLRVISGAMVGRVLWWNRVPWVKVPRMESGPRVTGSYGKTGSSGNFKFVKGGIRCYGDSVLHMKSGFTIDRSYGNISSKGGNQVLP